MRAAAEAEGTAVTEVQPVQRVIDEVVEVEEPQLKFRNYSVKDRKRVAHEQLTPAQPPVASEPVIEPVEDSEDPLANVAPRKANWDLRRDVAKKLEKLDRRTQRAMLTLTQQQQRQQIEDDGGVRD